MIVSARLKASFDHAVAIGWNAERFAREGKRLKSLAEYLKPKTEQSPDAGAADLRAMFARMAKKQEGA